MEGSSNEIIHAIVKPEMSQLDIPEAVPENNQNVSPNERNSIFSITIDEFEEKSVNNFETINMDDLLNDLWNAEGNSSINPNRAEINRLSRQNSFSVATPISNKTLEEVWDEITSNNSPKNNPNLNVYSNGQGLDQGQQTLGEITLEDFLVKVGVIQDGSSLIINLTQPHENSFESFYNNGNYLGPFNGQGSMITGLEHSQSNVENIMGVNWAPTYAGYTSSPIFMSEGSTIVGKSGKFNGVKISGNNKGAENRRLSSDRVELSLDRKERRMIKNRESAARSRARKNAYTCELEHELEAQRKENAALKFMLAQRESENKRKQEVLKDQPEAKTYQREEKRKIKRTLSAGW